MSPRVLNRALVVLAIFAVSGTVWLVGRTQRETVSQSFAQTQAAEGMLTAMLDQETGLRGYLLNAKQEEFLEPFNNGIEHYDDALLRLRRLTDPEDRRTHALIDDTDVAARAWTAKAERLLADVRAGVEPEAPLTESISRKAVMDGFRRADATLLGRLAERRQSALDSATRSSAFLVLLLGGVFGFVGWLVFGRRASARARYDRAESRRREAQASFARALQFMDSESDAHDLVKRHLERTLDGTDVVVLQRNNSADRLEAVTAVGAGSALAAELVDAAPRDCLAVRLGQTFSSAENQLLECSLCGKAAAELTTCTPLLVQGEVIGAMQVSHDEPLDDISLQVLDDTVAQAAPVLANMRNLAIAERRAATDALTGLPNRRAIADTLRRMVAQAARSGLPMAVIAVDLDHFKRINDHFGHDKGDDVLSAAARTFAATLRASDFVGRQGGEEFIALLPDTDLAGAVQAAEHLRAATEAIAVDGVGVPITASFGVASLPGDGGDADQLMRRADRALYAAKERGRNRVETAAAVAAELPQTAA